IGRLAAIENVCGIKVGRPHARYLELLAAVGDTILVCSPHEETWLENMRDHGQRVYMSSAAPYLYQTPGWQPMRGYTAQALRGDFAGAQETAATLGPVRAAAGKWLAGRHRQIDNIASIKAWAGLLGMSGGTARPPLPSLTARERHPVARPARCGPQRAAERRAPVPAVERAVDHVRVHPLDVGGGLGQLAEDDLIGEVRRMPAQLAEQVPGMPLLDAFPVALWEPVGLRGEDLDRMQASRCPAGIGQGRGSHEHPCRVGEEPAGPQIRAHPDH